MLGLRREVMKNVILRQVGSQLAGSFHDFVRRSAYSSKNIFDSGQPTAATHPQLFREGEMTPGITCDEYISRRRRLLELLPEKGLAIIASAPVKMMTDVVPYTFRQDADYLYITGCQQPGGVAIVSNECGLCMFMPDPSPQEVIWQGEIAGVNAALDTFKAEQAFPIRRMREMLPEMIGRASKLFHNVKTASPIYTDLDAFRKATYDGKVKDLSQLTHELRWIKSPSELELMRQSASIACQLATRIPESRGMTSLSFISEIFRAMAKGVKGKKFIKALLQTMIFSRTSPDESMLSAKVEYECRMRGAQRMAFNPVVGGGANASVIHYSRNDQKIKDGELVLMDIGCELHGSLSDLTRTWPPCGKFSPAQEALYDLILETNKECVDLCKPGVSIQQLHDHSVELLCRGLIKLGILKDDRKNLKSYHQLNPTSIGHYLGMDIHDCSMIKNDRPLQPGVIITIEPGVYIPSSFDAPERYQGIGIRIEDEVLITERGHEVLTGSMPKEIQHIRSLLNYGSEGMTSRGFRAASS